MSEGQINQRLTKILTRLNLSDKLSTLTVNQIKELNNPNKNSCVLTKLEILEKVLEKNSSKQNVRNYINQLKKEHVHTNNIPGNNNGNANSVHSTGSFTPNTPSNPLLRNAQYNNKVGKLAYWTSQMGHPMKGKVTGQKIKRKNGKNGIELSNVKEFKNGQTRNVLNKSFSKLPEELKFTNKNYNSVPRNNFNSYK